MRLAGPPVDLLDPPQVAPVDEERIDLGPGDPLLAE